jgi:2,5-diketo-D-gluconate reductase A
MKTTTTPTVTLNNGVEMPVLGFGVYQIPAADTEQAVGEALVAGYRSLDTAAAYQNEQAVGRAIAASGIARDELFVTTKLWIQNHGEETGRRAFETSLEQLGLDHITLSDPPAVRRLLRLLARDAGAERRGNRARDRRLELLPDRLVDLIEHNEIVPAVNQVECHPFFQRAADQELMRERGVQIESWGPFAEGRNNLFSDPTLSEIGAAHGKSVAQVVLRWLIQRDVVVIPKSVRPERMRENFDVFDFELGEDEMQRIAALDTGLRSSSTTAIRRSPASSGRSASRR